MFFQNQRTLPEGLAIIELSSGTVSFVNQLQFILSLILCIDRDIFYAIFRLFFFSID